MLLGCGGSARAVVAALVELGCSSIAMAGRSSERLAALLATCQSWAPQLRELEWAEGSTALAEALAMADLVVNTTPVGMAAAGNPDATRHCPLSPGELEALRPGATMSDLIYTPRTTALLQAASQLGCRALDGLEMLVQQGAASLRRWSGLDQVPVAAMRAAALAQLGP